MSVTPLSLFQSLSVVAVILSGTAIFISQKEDQPEFTGTSEVGAVDTSVLEETISQLRGDLLTMQMRLDLLEQPTEESTVKSDEIEAEGEIQPASLQNLEARVVAAVDQVMDRKGAEYARAAQRAAKFEGAREGMSRWVNSAQEKLPNLHDRIADEMDLDYQTELQVEEILANSFATMTAFTEQLYADPPLDDLEQRAVMGEVKEEVGVMIGELDEILEDPEMIQLGLIYMEEVDPRVGVAIVEEGKDNDEEGEEQDQP